MTERDIPWPVGTPCWVDMMTTDLEFGSVFYEGLFGWHLAGSDGYLMAEVDGRPVAGLSAQPPGSHDEVPSWTTYLATQDAVATAAVIVRAGGTMLAHPVPIGDVGVYALAADPSGGVFGLWQAGAHLGMRLANVANTPTWNELMTPGYQAAKRFYAEVFGYTYADVGADGFPYATIEVGGAAVGGLGEVPADVAPEVPAQWRVYFAVDDADETVDCAVRLGGDVLAEPTDSPYGRIADVCDPQGAEFSVIAPAAEQASEE